MNAISPKIIGILALLFFLQPVSAALIVFEAGGTLTADDLNTNFDELNNAISQPITLGDSNKTPALSCLDLKTRRPNVGDGVYWLKPASAKDAFRIYCDMTTDGGGWALVWSNLRGGRGKIVTEMQWLSATNTPPRYRGELSKDLESFEVYVGLKYWLELAPGVLKQFRYDWARNYQVPIDQSYACPFTLDSADSYRINFITADCISLIGNIPPILVTHHNGMRFSTYDNDNDTHATANCASDYSSSPWWFRDCWSGSILG